MNAAIATSHLGWRLAALSVGQVLSWGILYYALIVASPVIAEDTGWSLSAVTLTFSIGLIVSAFAGIRVGRWLDERGPQRIITLGSLIGPAGLLLVSVAPSVFVFALGWLIVGVAQAAVLYQAAFTVIARRYGLRSRGPMTVLTLAGGLASTVFAPIVAGLLGVMDWRSMYQVLAALLLVTTVPLHWFSLERTWVAQPHERKTLHTLGSVLRTRRFWMLEISMLLLVAAVFAVTLALIPLLTEKGLSFQQAAWGLGLLGAGQVVGRLIFFVMPRSVPSWVPLSTTASLAAVSLALLSVVPGPPWALITIGVLAGAIRGAQTLIQASAVIDRWGSASYGSINGVFAAPLTVVIALAPALGPLAADLTGSYSQMALVAALLAALAGLVARWS
ncbi:MFS transporter [Leucobacter sp. W1153]|uniref:MFS transporter n=1 Tax=Leucobacter sp. W1153 TaxID=3439064 RepID=UPI003F40F6EF